MTAESNWFVKLIERIGRECRGYLEEDVDGKCTGWL